MRSTWSEQPMTTASNLIASARTKPWPGTGPQTFTAAWPIRPSRPSATLASPKSCQSLDVGRHTTGANQPNDAYSTAPCSSASPSTTMRTPPTHPMRPQPASSRTPASMPWLKSPQRQTWRHQAGRAWILMVALAQYTPNTPVELRPPAARITDRPVITKRRATKRVRQRVVELYQSGRSARYVAGEVGVSRTTVLNILIQSGVERRPVGPVPRAI